MFGVNSIFIDDMAMDYISFIGFIIPVAIILSTPVIKYLWNKININISVKSIIKVIVTLVIFMFSILACVSSTYNPFIYFNF